MAKTARRLQLVGALGLVVFGLAGSSPAAFGAEPERPAIRILVMNNVGVPPPDILARAQAETARIYAAVGVRLDWTDSLPTLPRLTMMIASATATSGRSSMTCARETSLTSVRSGISC